MTVLHKILLLLASAFVLFICVVVMKQKKASKNVFFYCLFLLVVFGSLPFLVDGYSHMFNQVLAMKDARISLAVGGVIGLSVFNIYLLSELSEARRKLQILNRDISLLKSRMGAP